MPLNGCTIGVEEKDGKISWIFVRNAVQLIHTGTMLYRYYGTYDKAIGLIDDGDLINIGASQSGKSRMLDSRYPKWMQSCVRTGHPVKGLRSGTIEDLEEFSYSIDCMCIYLFESNAWWFKSLEQSHPLYVPKENLFNLLHKYKIIDPIEDLLHTAKSAV